MDKQHKFQFIGDNLTSEQRYKQVINASTTRVWQHLDQRTSDIPEDCDWQQLTPEQQRAVGDVLSVEKEWILDEDDLRECSMFKFDET